MFDPKANNFFLCTSFNLFVSQSCKSIDVGTYAIAVRHILVSPYYPLKKSCLSKL